MKKNKMLLIIITIISLYLIPFTVKAEPNELIVNIEPPKIGSYSNYIASHSTLSDYRYVLSTDLFNNTDNVVVLGDTRIKKNKDYTLKIRLDIRNNNDISFNDTTVLLQGYQNSDFFVSIGEPVVTQTSYEITLGYNTTVDKNKIYGALNCNTFKAPNVGKKFPYNTINENDPNKKYYEVTQGWYEQGSNTLLTASNTVQANKIYEYRLELTPKTNYTFSDYISLELYPFKESSFYFLNHEVTHTNSKLKYVFVYDTTLVENTIYGPIEIDLSDIEIGKEIKPIVSKDNRYTISGNWICYNNYGDSHQAEAGDVFEAGNNYIFNLNVNPNEGYQVDPRIEFALSPNSQSNNLRFYDYKSNNANIYVSFQEYLIGDIYNANTSEASPKINNKPVPLRVYSYTDGNEIGYEIESQEWYEDDTKMTSNSVFQKNKQYKLVVKYKTRENYVFDTGILPFNLYSWTGSDFYSRTNLASYNSSEVVLEYEFNTAYQWDYIYDTLNITTTSPVIGQHPSFSAIMATDYSKKSETWYNLTDHKIMTESDVFTEGKIYTYNLVVKPSPSRHFSTEFSITSNFSSSPYYDSTDRLHSLQGGIGFGTAYEEEVFIYSASFIISNHIDDSNALIGMAYSDPLVPLPKNGTHISYKGPYSEKYIIDELKDNGLSIEKAWYLKDGDGKVLSENDIYESNKTYEFHLKYKPIAGKTIIPGLIIDYYSEYLEFVNNPYFKSIRRNYDDNSFEIIITYTMRSTTYSEDNTIIKYYDFGTLQEPAIGGNISFNERIDEVGLTVTEEWYSGDSYTNPNSKLTTSDTFIANNRYLHYLKITPKEGYTFSDNFKIDLISRNSENVTTFYDNIEKSYICLLNYTTSTYIDTTAGFFAFKKSQYEELNRTNYTIPRDVDSITLEVDKKSGEFDISFSGMSTALEELDCDIYGDTVIISGLKKYIERIENYQNTSNYYEAITMEVTVDENDTYERKQLYYYINYEPKIDTSMVTLPTITNYEGLYDGNNHSIGVEGGSGGTILYSLDSINWQEELPQVSKAGTTKIYVTIDPDEGYISLPPTYGLVILHQSIEQYDITYYSNDGTGQTKNQKVYKGDSATLTKNTFERDGYSFVSWTTNPDGSGSIYFDEQVLTPSSNLNLYAKWKKLPTTDGDVYYKTHVQSYGWQDYVADGEMSGTEGEAKRLEGIKIKLNSNKLQGSILYRTHIQSLGWETNFKRDDEMSGTEGKALRLEAIEIKLEGEVETQYDVYYRVHAQSFGWLGWARNGESAGTASFAKRLEGIQIKLVPKDQEFTEYGQKEAFKDKQVIYKTHVQSYGWETDYAYDGNMSGTSGQSLRLEGIVIQLNNQKYPGDIEYRTHIQGIGWESTFKKNGDVSGTFGQAKRLEAIQIRLTGEMSEYFDVYYRVHAQSFGWLAWAKNNEEAGTAGLAKRLEGIEIVLVSKGESPPVRTDQNNNKAFVNS